MDKIAKRILFPIDTKIVITVLLLLTVSLSFSFLSIDLFILVFFGFLPTVAAAILDVSEKKYLSRLIFSFNIIGMLKFLIAIVKSINELEEISYSIIHSSNTWLIVYSSCAMGWFVYLFFPKILFYLLYLKKSLEVEDLTKDLEILKKDWGVDVSKDQES